MCVCAMPVVRPAAAWLRHAGFGGWAGIASRHVGCFWTRLLALRFMLVAAPRGASRRAGAEHSGLPAVRTLPFAAGWRKLPRAGGRTRMDAVRWPPTATPSPGRLLLAPFS